MSFELGQDKGVDGIGGPGGVFDGRQGGFFNGLVGPVFGGLGFHGFRHGAAGFVGGGGGGAGIGGSHGDPGFDIGDGGGGEGLAFGGHGGVGVGAVDRFDEEAFPRFAGHEGGAGFAAFLPAVAGVKGEAAFGFVVGGAVALIAISG